jgi:hypothetical protein
LPKEVVPAMLDHPTTGYFRHVRLRPDRITIHNAFFDRDFREMSDEGQIF